ncbi:uncharacterized protein LOC131243228 isoform X2 [Magnolia sinica]|uniref:uncharacterized protein LOC131243228 isoform X2 n=1 Tax=Magnolia sinica TaxID=86752 RepID=UPI0026581AC7|nr:uncharacterized protein LOC131243228 isoform X2 [Magnolia sinica]
MSMLCVLFSCSSSSSRPPFPVVRSSALSKHGHRLLSSIRVSEPTSADSLIRKFVASSSKSVSLNALSHLLSNDLPSLALPKTSIQTVTNTRGERKMAMYRSWLGTIRNKLVKSPRKRVIVLHSNSNDTIQREVQVVKEKATHKEGSCSPRLYIRLSEDDMAAIKIQAFFRGHLARMAFRALRSLVKLQAVVRGVCVRKQARIALHCMHALVRLQVRVRARQLLSVSGDAQLHSIP